MRDGRRRCANGLTALDLLQGLGDTRHALAQLGEMAFVPAHHQATQCPSISHPRQERRRHDRLIERRQK